MLCIVMMLEVVWLLILVEDAGQLVFHKDEKSAGSNVSSVSRLQLQRREARIRQQACQLYQSQMLEDVFLRLEVEVESRRLTMRLDRTIHSDIGLQERLLEVLNSYSTVWLRLGVEVYASLWILSFCTVLSQMVVWVFISFKQDPVTWVKSYFSKINMYTTFFSGHP